MSEARETRTAPLGLRITPSLKAALEEAAAEDHRPLASYVEKLLVEHLSARGFLSLEQPHARRIAQGAAEAKAMAHSAIDEALQAASPSVRRDRRRALTEMPARAVVKDRRRK